MLTTENALEVGAEVSRRLTERRKHQRREKAEQKSFEKSLCFIGLRVPRAPNGHVILER